MVLAAGCSDGPSEPEAEAFNPSGSLRFTYSGAVAGSFQAVGEIQQPAPGVSLQAGTGALAFRQDSLLSVVGTRAVSATRVDLFTLVLGGVGGTGTFQIAPLECTQQSLSSCRIALFALDVEPPADLGGGIDPAPYLDRTYIFLQGSITVTSFSSTRIRGTFSGTAARANAQGLGGLILISGGQFDVPVQAGP